LDVERRGHEKAFQLKRKTPRPFERGVSVFSDLECRSCGKPMTSG
jgi:hypothetical protein